MTIPGHIDPVPVPRPAFESEDPRVDLVGLSREAIRDALAEAGLELKQAKLRAKQIWHQIYNRGATSFDAMSDIAKPQRAGFAERFGSAARTSEVEQVSTDGTRKWLLQTDDGHDFEMVFIPDADRGPLCVSSQVGCTLNCRFCHTGTMRLVRNLTPARSSAGDAGAGLAGRMAVAAGGADALQHRHDGHGRAALQFRQCRDALKT
jgi:23S rRNA (adenine2503-C2)-methyltransferase